MIASRSWPAVAVADPVTDDRLREIATSDPLVLAIWGEPSWADVRAIAAELRELREENARLRDETERLWHEIGRLWSAMPES